MCIDKDVSDLRVLVHDAIDLLGGGKTCFSSPNMLERRIVFILGNSEDDIGVGAPWRIGKCNNVLEEFFQVLIAAP